MLVDIFVTLGIFSSWLVFYSVMLFIALEQDNSFNYIIFNKMQLFKYLAYVTVFVIFCYYVFMVRLTRVGMTLNIYELILNIYELILYQTWVVICLSSILIILGIIFVFLLSKWLYLNLRRCLVTLYIFFYQYRLVQLLYFKVMAIRVANTVYLLNRVSLFTKNPKILWLTLQIWPQLLLRFEPRIIKMILPYLVIFDILTQDWIISKVFVLMPWYYIYIILRQLFLGIALLFTPENLELSDQLYQQFEVNGKIIRWVNIMSMPQGFPRQEYAPQKK